MSASSFRKMNKDEQVAVSTPKWLEEFLKNTFFDLCTVHVSRKNELKKYCIDCNLSACQFCISSGTHRHHKILKIYRHVYKDVVSLAAMEKLIDCTLIQPYKCNKRLVIPLSPLPHSGSASSDEAPCSTCSRRLTEPQLYRYCSISCKVKAVSRKTDDSVSPLISIESAPEEKKKETSELSNPPEEKKEQTAEPSNPPEENKEETYVPPPGSLRKRRRKGTPYRAPFF